VGRKVHQKKVKKKSPHWEQRKENNSIFNSLKRGVDKLLNPLKYETPQERIERVRKEQWQHEIDLAHASQTRINIDVDNNGDRYPREPKQPQFDTGKMLNWYDKVGRNWK
jgi:hypothetical protein